MMDKTDIMRIRGPGEMIGLVNSISARLGALEGSLVASGLVEADELRRAHMAMTAAMDQAIAAARDDKEIE